ncbi:type-F conjugative transfer system pilin acetylase TraX [Salmonella enterica subsp. enterica serovar Saintpaul]|nr:type-F conjugative transfer system pilin acetylase TraX [Salmonella enterica subsp. enterica serovar Saintpaul]EIW8031990.1 type-F conjugative transfer system pilin acetylase TraX [Salmonella enterica]EHY8945540.1 type-F conjugative transfer system pilin acetylase TraX [Salmonella enterica subsp. enterica serovar Saintpaul]EIT9276227.1 type-F conjugative transfer system pilin acetylase TraX [Salmonella enterica subsp. enterica serovar Saintpaul]EJP5413447.1 type-F conjugative transfer system
MRVSGVLSLKMMAHTLSSVSFPMLTARQCDALKLAAFAAMVADHLNTASGLNDTLLQAVGRLAFPLFAVVWGCNIVRRPATQAGLNRLWLMALLAQPGFWLVFRDTGVEWWQVNILFTFAVMGQVVRFMQSPCNLTAFVSLLVLSAYIPVSGASYELRGLLLLMMSVLFFLTTGRQQLMTTAGLAASVLLLNAPSGGVMMLSGLLLSLMTLVVVCRHVPQGERLPGGRWFAHFYCLHLTVIGGVLCLV